MALWHVAEAFGTKSEICTSEAELRQLLEDAIRELGYTWFALVFGVGWGCPLNDWLWLYNYPAQWEDQFFAEGYYANDPVLRTSERTSEPFAWPEAHLLTPGASADFRIFELAARMGLVHGYTCPFNRVREPSGSCSFVNRYHRDLTMAERQCTLIIGSFALAAARRLRGFPEAALPRPELTPHLHACIELVAMGKTDPEIAGILNVSPNTARTYVKRVRDLFNVTGRAQLGPEALRLGVIGFSDIKPPGAAD